ncbi:hypothetical protein SAMD00019534_118800 [Acytostelium subglobosum LB1]|uniref:hypothetical protein n=1 Tax=Acytostelium subglobosum LB1 TaxID=1410327 RepID=UPI000644B3B8|nr:hypothetical protein SAMD00019534_118800 [Acytostelium subglobosum LB1]GAM28704.1 hypothetical protein SAMD00019534_118800 [Acytostelium subglobosum LB1]|eukprot:XP_012748259.1 hypothetical protein SAMD00019534_118800 [Acytostelium subglobosum LB1]
MLTKWSMVVTRLTVAAGLLENSYYSKMIATPDGYFCVKSGKDRRITYNTPLRTSRNSDDDGDDDHDSSSTSADENDQDDDGEEYLHHSTMNLKSHLSSLVNNDNDDYSNNNNKENRYLINSSLGTAQGKNGQIFFVTGAKDRQQLPQQQQQQQQHQKKKQQHLEHQRDEPKLNNKNNNSSTNNFAVKRQYISSPGNKQNQCYRELIILEHLGKLMSQNKSCNFVTMVEWYKTAPYDGTDNVDVANDQLDNQRHRYLRTKDTGDKIHLRTQQYMNFVLEYADLKSLYTYRQTNDITLRQYKSILFQVLHALSIAQRDLEFMHNDLHIGNILLQSLPTGKKYIMYQDDLESSNSSDTDSEPSSRLYQTWVVDHSIVKISDYGLSRIRIPESNKVIHNQRNADSKHFFYSNDLQHLSCSLLKLRISDIQAPENLEQRKILNNLRKRIQDSVTPPFALLSHRFFHSLRMVPLDATEDNCIRLSSDGIIPEFPSPKSTDGTTDEIELDDVAPLQETFQVTGNSKTPSKPSAITPLRQRAGPKTPQFYRPLAAKKYSSFLRRPRQQVIIEQHSEDESDDQVDDSNDQDAQDEEDVVNDKELDDDQVYTSNSIGDLTDQFSKLSTEVTVDGDQSSASNNVIDVTVDTLEVVATKKPKKKKLTVSEKLNMEGQFIIKRLINPH